MGDTKRWYMRMGMINNRLMAGALRNPVEQMVQGGCQQGRLLLAASLFGNHVDINRGFEPMLVQTKILAHTAFDPVSGDGVSDLFGHCNAQSGDFSLGRGENRNKVSVLNPFSPLTKSQKLRPFSKALLLGVGERAHGLYALRRLRPLALLRLMMRRPALVDILFRNPCVRALLILLG